MNSAFRTTALMGLLAVGFAIAAAAVYPWPTAVTEDAQIGKPLVENYDTSTVRTIELTQLDLERDRPDRLELKRSGERWLMPQRNGFDVTGGQRVIDVVRSLNDRIVLEINSDSQTDHAKFGVVDPSEGNRVTSRASLGKRLELFDRNRQSIANVIIGNEVKGSPDKRYARIAGQPAVYTIEFDASILDTEFSQWVSPNLLGLPTSQSKDRVVSRMHAQKYRLAAQPKAKSPQAGRGEREDIYQVTFENTNTNDGKSAATIEPTKLSIDGKTQPVAAVSKRLLSTIGTGLYGMRLSDVNRVDKETAAALRSPNDENSEGDFESLTTAGFIFLSTENSKQQFDATNGELTVTLADGVSYQILVGNLVNDLAGGSSGLKLLYQVMIRAEVDSSVIPKVEKPADVDTDESIKKAYLRKVKDRDQRLSVARSQVKNFNRIHSQWLYVMDEDVIGLLLPEMESAVNMTLIAEQEDEAKEKADQ